jgi:hypothetical protein
MKLTMKEKFETVVAAENSSDALSKARNALGQLGYKLTYQAGGIESYSRGTLLGSMLAFSPRGAKSTVLLELVPSGLSIKIVIQMLGSIGLLPNGIRYWQMELDHISSLAEGEASDVKRVKFKRPPVLKIMLITLITSFIAIGIMAVVVMVLNLNLSALEFFANFLLRPIIIAGAAIAIYNYSK